MSFRPTAEQRDFRDLARRAYDDREKGGRWVADWCRLTRGEDWPHKPVTRAVWDAWENSEGFAQWWLEAFPEAAPLCVTDQELLEFRFWHAVGRGLDNGEGWAAHEYAAMKAIRAVGAAIGDPAFDAWLHEPTPGRWRGHVGDAK